MPHLTQKERMLLQDQLSHEQICITKYSGYAARTRDPELRRMFHEFAADEQRHYDTINNLLQGSSQGQGQSQAGTRQQSGAQARRGQQAGSQGAGWQATQSGITGSMVETGGQAGSTLGQTGSYRATPGGQGQNWMSETRTVYGGQISQGTGSGGVQGGQATRQSQGTQGTGMTQSSQQASPSQQTQSGRSPMNFESASELSMSTSDDKSMLEDMLMTEKYISGAYDTAVFETSNQQVRQALQHIQQDEQRHGEEIFKYMQQKGMYQPQ